MKHGPQILPKSFFLLTLTSTLSFLISCTINSLSAALTELIFVITITSTMLLFLGHELRLIQTLTAVMGSSVIVGVVVVCVLAINPAPNLLVRLSIFFLEFVNSSKHLKTLFGNPLFSSWPTIDRLRVYPQPISDSSRKLLYSTKPKLKNFNKAIRK